MVMSSLTAQYWDHWPPIVVGLAMNWRAMPQESVSQIDHGPTLNQLAWVGCT